MTEHEKEYEHETEGHRQVTGFDKLGETQNIVNSILSVPLTTEPLPEEERVEGDHLLALHRIVRNESEITLRIFLIYSSQLAFYQEQCYLLDPYLEQLVTPIANTFREHARSFASGKTEYSRRRVERLAWMLYYFVKFRGYKTIGLFLSPVAR